MDWADVIRTVRRYWLVVLAVLALAGGAAVVGSSRMETEFRSQARILIMPKSAVSSDDDYIAAVDALNRGTPMVTLAEMATGVQLRDAAAADIGKQDEAEQYTPEGSVVQGSNFVEVAVTGPDGPTAQLLVTGIVGRVLVDFPQAFRVFEVALVDTPSTPEATRSFGTKSLLAIALILGLVTAVVLVVFVETVRRALASDPAAARRRREGASLARMQHRDGPAEQQADEPEEPAAPSHKPTHSRLPHAQVQRPVNPRPAGGEAIQAADPGRQTRY